MEKETTFDCLESVLGKEILPKIIIPRTFRYSDVCNAIANFRSTNLACKILNRSGKTIKIVQSEGGNTEELAIGDYLQRLQKRVRVKNRLRNGLPMKIDAMKLFEFPKDGEFYPKLSLCLHNYHIYILSLPDGYFRRQFSSSQQAEEALKNDRENFNKVLTSLLENFHNVNQTDTLGHMPLYYAITNTQCPSDIVKLLIDYGAILEAIDGKGNNALQVAESIDSMTIHAATSYYDGDIEKNKLQKLLLLQKYHYLPKENLSKENRSNTKSCSIQ